MQSPLILGTRGSKLALWQAQFVRDRLHAAGYVVEVEIISTVGDRRLDVPLSSIGEKGLFTRELDEALLRGDIHLAVHSLKDLPSTLPEGIALAAVPERESPLDAFVPHPDFDGGIGQIPVGATLATSSLRRQAQLKQWPTDLNVVPVRGNVDTRLRKLAESDWTGLILAEAGLVRLGLQRHIRTAIPTHMMIPAVGQGALGIVCAAENQSLVSVLRNTLHHDSTGTSTSAERAFLARIEGGCSVPVAAHATVDGAALEVHGFVGSLDGKRTLREKAVGKAEFPEAVGRALAERMLSAGAGEILAEIRSQQAS